jgi:Mrp family chromosome partitioning ATPase
MRLNMSQASESAVQTRIFLESQRTLAEQQLKKIDEAIKQFQLSNGVVNLPDQVTALITRKTAVEGEIQEVETKNREQEARVNYIGSRLGINPDVALDAQEIAADPVFASLSSRLSALEYQYADLSARYKPEHPRMRQIKATINDLEQATAKRLRTLFNQSGIQVKHLNDFDALKSKLLQEMVDAKTTLMLDEVRKQALQPVINAVDGQLHDVPSKQLELAEMERAEKVAAERVSEIERSINQAKLMEAVNSHTSNFQIIDRPQVSGVTVASKMPKLASALVLAAFLAIATFFGLDMMDPRLRRVQPILQTLPLPVIGWMNHVPSPLHLQEKALESMHRLRLSLRSWMAGDKAQLIIASADNGDGRSALAAGLAMSFAESGASVLLIDADPIKPIQHKVFNVSPTPGLSDYLISGNAGMWSTVVRNVNKNLKLITCGSQAVKGSVLASDALKEMMEKARQEADIVIYDTPASKESAAALALLSPSSHLLVVARLNHTFRPDLRLLSTQLRQHEFAAGALVLVNADDDAVAAALTKGAQADDEES